MLLYEGFYLNSLTTRHKYLWPHELACSCLKQKRHVYNLQCIRELEGAKQDISIRGSATGTYRDESQFQPLQRQSPYKFNGHGQMSRSVKLSAGSLVVEHQLANLVPIELTCISLSLGQ